jgi:hypothetical protein
MWAVQSAKGTPKRSAPSQDQRRQFAMIQAINSGELWLNGVDIPDLEHKNDLFRVTKRHSLDPQGRT